MGEEENRSVALCCTFWADLQSGFVPFVFLSSFKLLGLFYEKASNFSCWFCMRLEVRSFKNPNNTQLAQKPWSVFPSWSRFNNWMPWVQLALNMAFFSFLLLLWSSTSVQCPRGISLLPHCPWGEATFQFSASGHHISNHPLYPMGPGWVLAPLSHPTFLLLV